MPDPSRLISIHRPRLLAGKLDTTLETSQRLEEQEATHHRQMLLPPVHIFIYYLPERSPKHDILFMLRFCHFLTPPDFDKLNTRPESDLKL